MVIRTSLVLDEQLQVLQVSAIAVAVVASKSQVSLERMTLLANVDNLVTRTIVNGSRSSLQNRGTHEGRQKKE
jgi:hypothetical protein